MLYGYNGGRKTFCKCICDCGNEKIICVDNLKRSRNPSCGCMSAYYRSIHNRTNETGRKYGRLTIINIDYTQKKSIAICKCDCGNIVRISKSDVVSGHTKSCGCLHREKTSKANTKDFTGYISLSGVEIINKSYKNEKGVWIWNCRCPICKNIFEALPAKIINNHTTSCGCKIQSSKERIIESILLSFNISFEKEKRFKDCKYKYTLPFDFAIFDDNKNLKFLIEYDGQQHYKKVDFFDGEEGFKKTKIRDEIKNKYCESNNIKLLRFNYKQTNDEIKKIITNTIYP